MANAPDLGWWIPSMQKSIDMMEKATRGKHDDELVKLPLGDARFDKVSVIRKLINEKRYAINYFNETGKLLPL
jgi:hypothetical protein